MAKTTKNGQKHLIPIVLPQVRTKMREKGKRGKKQWISQRKITLICTHMYTYLHIIYYSSQIVLFNIMFESI